MTTYVSSGNIVSGLNAETLGLVELRTISNVLQRDMPAQSQEELRILRNDQAFELGISPPVIPGN
jgi:hypothetical protein